MTIQRVIIDGIEQGIDVPETVAQPAEPAPAPVEETPLPTAPDTPEVARAPERTHLKRKHWDFGG